MTGGPAPNDAVVWLPREAPPPLPPPSRVLVSRLRRIGDVILTLPLVDALRARFPEARIDYLAEEGPAQAAVGHPAIERVLSFRSASGGPLPGPLPLLRALRAARYDWTIDLYGNPRSAMLLAWTGAPVRVGPARGVRRLLYTHLVPPVPEPISAVRHHLLALAALGIHADPVAPRLYLSDEERARGAALLDAAIPPGEARVGLHVGNRWPAKRWPPERFAALARALPGIGARAVILGGPGEDATVSEVAERSRAARLPALPLRDYWAALSALDALVTNDGSPLHAGPALGVPTIGILGPTVPAIWFPYREDEGHRLLCREIWCRPCHRHECARLDCLTWIGVDDAVDAVARALERREARLATV